MTSNENYGGIFPCYTLRGAVMCLVMTGLWDIDELGEMGRQVEEYLKIKGE